VTPGAADRSYGVQVAKLAGLPRSVFKRARQMLADLEASRPSGTLDSLPLFSYEPRERPQTPPDELRAAVAAHDPDAMSTREALEAIYALKRRAETKAN
jgi:DNA mismatch repair protein MutS